MKKQIILISGLAIIIMLIYTILLYNIMFSPSKIFNKAIDKTVKKINENIPDITTKTGITDINFKFYKNLNNLKSFSNYTYGVKFGTDEKSKSAGTKIYMTDKNNKEYSYTGYIKNSNLYHKLSSLDKLILYNVENQDLTAFFENTNQINTSDIKYLINLCGKSLKKNINKKSLSKNKTTITINNKKIKVTKNTYKINPNEMKRLYKAIYNDLYNDQKAIEIISSMSKMTKEEIKNEINNENFSYIENKEITLNIYNNLSKIIGFDIYENNENIISYYTKNDNFNLQYGNYNITGTKKNNNKEINIKLNNTEIANLVFSKYQKNDFAFDFISDNYIGKISYKKENKTNYEAKLSVSLNDGKNNYSFDITAKQNINSKVADIDTNAAQKLTEEEFSEVLTNFIKSLNDTPLEFLNDLFIPNEELDYSYYNY